MGRQEGEMQDPEMSIEQAIADYKRLGYSDQWINRSGQDRQIRHILRKSLRLSVAARRKRGRLMSMEQ